MPHFRRSGWQRDSEPQGIQVHRFWLCSKARATTVLALQPSLPQDRRWHQIRRVMWVAANLVLRSQPWTVAKQCYGLTQESEKAGLKLNIQKTKIMASGSMTSYQIDGETVETVRDLILLGSNITAGGDCSHEIKRCLLLGTEAMMNLHSILKSRDITLLTKVHLVKAMVLPVVIYGYESWTIKKAESRRINAFELWCWRRLLRVPWMAKRSK